MDTLVKIALTYGEVHCLSYAMNSLAAEYIEGYVNSARDKFNKYWQQLNKQQKQQVIDDCVFEPLAISLAEKNGLEMPYRKTGEHTYEYIRKQKDPRLGI